MKIEKNDSLGLDNLLSTILGVATFMFSGVLLFVDTNFNLSIYHIGAIAITGILLTFAKDKLVGKLLNKVNENHRNRT